MALLSTKMPPGEEICDFCVYILSCESKKACGLAHGFPLLKIMSQGPR